jgi:hypothetical protein
MNDAHQTPLEEAISFLTIVAILVAVGCYAAAVQNIPVASPALFWVSSVVYPLVSGFERYKGTTDAHAGERCGGWRHLLCCGYTVRGFVGYVVFKRTNRELGATDGEAAAQPSPDSKAAPRSRSI